jgi:hypothetical protein
MAREEGASGAEMDPSYRAWLDSNPVPGEVFVDTGEASAADSRKLRWSPTKAQRETIRKAIAADVAMVNALYQDETQDVYAGHIEGLVEQTLRNVGVDPDTLASLPKVPGSQDGH